MLAKVWKKALLAVCIIACIYNVMHKLVSRTSLEIQLRSVQEQTSLTDSSNNNKDSKNDEKDDNSSETKEVNANEVKTNSVSDKDTIVVIY